MSILWNFTLISISVFLSLLSMSLASWFSGFLFPDSILAHCYGSGVLLCWFFDPNQILRLQLIRIRISSLYNYWQHSSPCFLMQKESVIRPTVFYNKFPVYVYCEWKWWAFITWRVCQWIFALFIYEIPCTLYINLHISKVYQVLVCKLRVG